VIGAPKRIWRAARTGVERRESKRAKNNVWCLS
jgi:hypothetical protein